MCQKDGRKGVVVAYASKGLSKSQKNYHPMEGGRMLRIDLGCDALEMSKVFKSLMKVEECAYSKIEMSRFRKDPEATFKYSNLRLKLNL